MVDVVSIGNANVDILLYTDKLPGRDEEVQVKNFEISAGGSASNFAVTITRLGCSCRFIGCIGEDAFGEIIINEFKREKVDARLKKMKGKPTGIVVILVYSSGERAMLAFRGANLSLTPADIREEMIADAKHVHVSGSTIEVARHALKMGSSMKKFTSYDPGAIVLTKNKDEVRDILKHVNTLFLNRKEFQ